QDAEALARIRAHLGESEKHYLREENVLFPVLERHGIVEPPRVMWSEHQEIRALKKEVQTAEGPRLRALAVALGERLAAHFFKENRILFPAALRVVPEGAWPHLRAQFDEIGYCCFTPAVPPAPVPAAAPTPPPPTPEIRLRFPTGELTPEEIEAIFNTLPVDITFVDKDDTVRYFNATKDRIFVRTPAVIGRKVQNCHSEKSLPVVERILREFREKKRAVAEFWIPHKGRFVYIRYFPVWGRNGEYLGTLEVSQDITRLRELSGEKRLLDEGPTA
ncbi:MAG: PAS domain-containing protein, partial [Candidatus Bipolaricaulaceae bacterium]